MAAVALIQLTQGVNVGTAGQALVGVTGSQVDIANNSNTSVASWQIDLIFAPQGSSLVPGTLAFNNSSATPSANFTPDVTGSYRLQLTVWENTGRTGATNTDIRVFGVKEVGGRGFLRPPSQIYPLGLPPVGTGLPTAKPDELNFGGQTNGWGGNTGSGLIDDLITHVDKTGVLTSSAPADVTKATAAVGTSVQSARADHKHDVSTAAPGAAAIGDSATEGTATSLARSDHKHSVAAGTPVTLGTANAVGSATTFPRSDHVHDHGAQSTGNHHAVATSSLNGFMASTDKALFDGIVTAVKQPVRAATTANITLSGTQTVDGVALVANDRCLAKNQTTGANNGIYVVAAGAWVRSADFNTSAEILGGTVISISEGTVNGNRRAQLTTDDPITLGTTALTFVVAPTLPGTTGNVPFNNGVDNFAADTKFTYDDSTDGLTVPGLFVTEDLNFTGVTTPTQITSDQNDYNPTNLATTSVLRLSTDATRFLTGLAGGASGRMMVILNVGSNDLVLINESVLSSAANRFTFAADFTLPMNESILLIYDNTSTRWRAIADATQQVLLRSQFGAADFDDPATDWTTTAAAAIAADTVNAGITVRRFDDTTEEGVGWDVLIPTPVTKVRFTIVGRAQTAPAATRTVGLALKRREIVNNGSVGSWASTTLTDVSLPTNANFQRSTQTLTLSTLSLTSNRFYQLELVRQNPTGGTELVGDWTLFTILVEWMA